MIISISYLSGRYALKDIWTGYIVNLITGLLFVIETLLQGVSKCGNYQFLLISETN